MEQRNQEKQDESFRDEIKYFLSKESFTIYDFHEKVIRGLQSKSGLKQMLFSDDTETKDLQTQNKICSAIYDSEKQSGYVSATAKKEIAEVSGATLEEVEDVFHKKKYFADFHAWLKAR